MLTIESVERVARYMHIGFLCSIAMFVAVLEFALHPALNPGNRSLYIVLLVLCIIILNSLVYFRQTYIAASAEKLRSKPTDQTALKNWQVGHVITFAACEAVALFGFVARILGAPKLLGYALFGVAVYTLIAYRPKPILQQ